MNIHWPVATQTEAECSTPAAIHPDRRGGMFCCKGRIYKISEDAIVANVTDPFLLLNKFIELTSDRDHLFSVDSFVNPGMQPRGVSPEGVGVVQTKTGCYVWISKVKVDIPKAEADSNGTSRSAGSNFVWEWSPGKSMRCWAVLRNAEQVDGIYRPLAHLPPALESMEALLSPATVDCTEVLWKDLSADDHWFLTHLRPLSGCLCAPAAPEEPYRERQAAAVKRRRDLGPPIDVNSMYWNTDWKADYAVTRSSLWSDPTAARIVPVNKKNCTLFSILPTATVSKRGCDASILPKEVVEMILHTVARRCLGMADAAAWPLHIATSLRRVCRDFRNVLDEQLDRIRIEALQLAETTMNGTAPPGKLPMRIGLVKQMLKKKTSWKTFKPKVRQRRDGEWVSKEEMSSHHNCNPKADHRVADASILKHQETRHDIVAKIQALNADVRMGVN